MGNCDTRRLKIRSGFVQGSPPRVYHVSCTKNQATLTRDTVLGVVGAEIAVQATTLLIQGVERSATEITLFHTFFSSQQRIVIVVG